MQHSFPHMYQAAMNLSNKSPEAIKIVSKWCASHGGEVEHLSFAQVRKEVLPLLKGGKK
ncbi:hypothetical protein LCGC14_2952720 [marine sediment metagenome]|uniref:Uncharacterized protein n=1 Tax=marine sediment metagenome TaxID=412755 RepID=A0A0F8XFB6_9ZZZZ